VLCGPTGTGKTTLIKDFYALKVDHKQIGFQEIVFSSKTTCTQVQDQIEGRLDKRGSKYLLGPKSNPKLIFFIDDLNMPAKEKFGAQPPIEFLRQIIDQKGFYDLK
jgi:dynein heavy chain, axonemal